MKEYSISVTLLLSNKKRGRKINITAVQSQTYDQNKVTTHIIKSIQLIIRNSKQISCPSKSMISQTIAIQLQTNIYHHLNIPELRLTVFLNYYKLIYTKSINNITQFKTITWQWYNQPFLFTFHLNAPITTSNIIKTTHQYTKIKQWSFWRHPDKQIDRLHTYYISKC